MEARQLLNRGQLFSCLAPAELARLGAQCEVRLVAAGGMIVRAESPQNAVVYLAQGKVALYRRNTKRDVTLLLGLVEAPSLFGDAECAAGTPWMCSARAEEDSWCVMIPNEPFLQCVDRHQELCSRLYRDACVRHLLANHTAQTLALYDVETRLLRLLLDYAYRFGVREGDSAVIEKPTSQVEMAAALGVTRKTIARTLLPLEKRKVISRKGASFVVHDLSKLERSLPRDLLGFSSRHGESIAAVTKRWPGSGANEPDGRA
jgi:CRP-like cAMP-binding protein